MLTVRLSGDYLYEKWLFFWLSLVTCIMMSYFLCCPFPDEMSWMRPGTEFSQLLRIFLSTHVFYLFSLPNINIVCSGPM